MKFLFPIDGDVLTPDDGLVVTDPLFGERIRFIARLAAAPGRTVTVNERPARETAPGIYEAESYTDGVRTTLEAVCGEERVSIAVFRFREAYGKVRLAIDDIIWSMRELAERAQFLSSIFEVPFFALFRELHEAYGSKVQMNLYYRDEGTFTLTRVPEKFKEEFVRNSDWLKFTFHAVANLPDHIYRESPYSEVLRDYHLVTNEILRFAGPEVNTDVNGLHFAETTLGGARALRSVGIRCLVGYFIFDEKGDPAIAYYLDRDRTAHCAGRDFWVDTAEDIIFSKDKCVIDTFRLEKLLPHLDTLKHERPHEAGTMNFVTHEQYFYPFYERYQPDWKQKIFTCMDWAARNGYTPAFLDDCFR